jgi:hypothetical protein
MQFLICCEVPAMHLSLQKQKLKLASIAPFLDKPFLILLDVADKVNDASRHEYDAVRHLNDTSRHKYDALRHQLFIRSEERFIRMTTSFRCFQAFSGCDDLWC